MLSNPVFRDGRASLRRAVVAGIITDMPATEPAFVVERFAAAGDRLEVAGHWRGLRGRRFVRPVLWLHRGDDRRRLVAVLDHKPWAADDGEPWIAAFAWNGGKLDAERAELEVGTRAGRRAAGAGAQRRTDDREPRPARPRAPVGARPSRASSSRAPRRSATAPATRPSRRAPTASGWSTTSTASASSALAAAEQATTRARDAEAALDLAQRQLAAARASHAELEERLAAAESDRADRAAGTAERERWRPS